MDFLTPLLFVLVVWWLSTVLLLHRTGKQPETFLSTLVVVSLAAVIGVICLYISANNDSLVGTYLGFSGALAVWALLESSYLLGFLTGPRARACPRGATSVERFWYGLQASLYHELAVVATALCIAAMTWGAASQIGLQTFMVLWLMRWSAKINIFLGVRNLHDEYWPAHLEYLKSYARQRTMNALFPWSVVMAGTLIVLLVYSAVAALPGSTERASALLLTGLLSLATLEHVFLMLQIPDDILWRMGTRSRRPAG